MALDSTNITDGAGLKKHTQQFFEWQKQIRECTGFHEEMLDEHTAISCIVEQLGVILGADRCALIQLKNDDALPVGIEYTSGPEVFSYKGLVPPWKTCPFLRKTAGLEFAYTEDTLEEEAVQADPALYQFFNEKGVRGGIGCPVVYHEKLLSVLIVHTVKPRKWKSDELSLVMLAADQIALVTVLAGKQRAEIELQQYNHQLKQSNNELEMFASIISHDLLVPLRKVSFFSEYLQELEAQSLSAEGKDYLARIERSTRKMQNQVKDLLDLSKVTRKGRPFKQVSLKDAMEEALFNLHYAIKDANGTVGTGHLDNLEADRSQIEQLLENLVENALKYNRPGVPPVVKVHSILEDAFCYIYVEDNGIGIDPDKQHRIYLPFERLNPGDGIEGTGIGLTICSKIVDRHRGTIRTIPNEPHGSKFIITLPVRQNA